MDIRDVWPENYSANSAQKVWAARFAARHPNLAMLDLSSFKCGHDAPDLRHHRWHREDREGALRRLARPRREQAGRVHPDPRAHLHPQSSKLVEEELEDRAKVASQELQRRVASKRDELRAQYSRPPYRSPQPAAK